MDTQASTGASNPKLFRAHPQFSVSVNGNIIRSEIEGGVYLRDLSPSVSLVVPRVFSHVFVKAIRDRAHG
jgi:hypothetical protein